jgi:PHD/YefM family antitoxin component YafN of YafNO toxin-antitoxin module
MEAVKVGMREFRDKFATYLLESESPVAITRHGDTARALLHPRPPQTERCG